MEKEGEFIPEVLSEELCDLANEIRIMCLGASTTANNISDGKEDYSYPKLLEDYLNKNSDKRFEVFNCGIGYVLIVPPEVEYGMQIGEVV